MEWSHGTASEYIGMDISKYKTEQEEKKKKQTLYEKGEQEMNSKRGLLASVGGLEYIMQLADSSVTSASTKYYIELIQSKALLRNLIETAQNIAEEGMQNAGDMESTK